MRQYIDLIESATGFRPVKNPSDRQIAAMVGSAREHRLRGIVAGRDLWLWDAFFAIHKQGADAIGIPYWPDGRDNRIGVNDEDGAPVFDFPADDQQITDLLMARFQHSDLVYFRCGSHGLLTGREAAALYSDVALTEGVGEYGGFFYEDDYVPVFDLRSPKDLAYALRKTGKNQELRGLVDDEHVIAWDSWKNVHHGVIEDFHSYNDEFVDDSTAEPLKTEWEAMIYLYADGVAMAPKRHGDIGYIRNHPILKAIYGGTVPIRAPRQGTS